MTKNYQMRDKLIVQDYRDGKEIHELRRIWGLSERRISQILRAQGVTRRPRRMGEKQALSRVHARIGLALYEYRTDNGVELFEAANDLEKSAIFIRKVEKGTTAIELLDLIDIAGYIGRELPDLIKDNS